MVTRYQSSRSDYLLQKSLLYLFIVVPYYRPLLDVATVTQSTNLFAVANYTMVLVVTLVSPYTSRVLLH